MHPPSLILSIYLSPLTTVWGASIPPRGGIAPSRETKLLDERRVAKRGHATRAINRRVKLYSKASRLLRELRVTAQPFGSIAQQL